jgi:hypothetical protein
MLAIIMHNFAAKCLTLAFFLSVLQAAYNMSVFSFYLVCYMTLKRAAKNYLMACQTFMAGWTLNNRRLSSIIEQRRLFTVIGMNQEFIFWELHGTFSILVVAELVIRGTVISILAISYLL